jgi:protein involved in polysaccharide export with SLBB domain
MNGNLKTNHRWTSVKFFFTLMVLTIPLLAGCGHDNRISMQEFLCMQEEHRLSPPSPPATPTTKPINIDELLGAYRVGPSDVLTLSLIRMDDLGVAPPIQVRVGRDGRIHLPMAGAVRVANLELEDLENRIRQAYVPKFYQDLTVHAEVVQALPTNVMVIGAVTAPGLVSLPRNERNLLYAIVGAGGASSMTSGVVNLKRLRRPGEDVTFNLLNPDDLRAALAQPPLENGDIITVQAAVPNIIFVGGLVNAPQPEVYPPGVEINILQAIAGAGGLRTDISPKEGTLIRRMPDGCDVHVKLELNRIFKGDEPNITLAAGDILWVPYTWQTRVEEWINRNFYIRFGVAATVNYNVSGIEYLNRAAQQSGYYNNNGGLQDTYDPLGFLNRNNALQTITGQPAVAK